VIDPLTLPDDLPRPEDDGAATQLLGERMPEITLPTTDGSWLALHSLGHDGLAIIFCYPWTGHPGEPLLVEEWDSIPGARGCTPETCGFRDLHSEFEDNGAQIIGLSTQGTAYQAELAQRLQLPFPILSDEGLRFTRALRLPTMEVGDKTLIKRLTLVVEGGLISKMFYPVFPPNRHASEVLAWLRLAVAGRGFEGS
jgi:peroxiredoxin